MENKRNTEIDILKGIAIILMVLGHAHFPANKFIHLFHMAVFFIASGYFYKSKYSADIKSLKNFAIKKIKTLYIPFVVYNIVFLICNNLFYKYNIINMESNDVLYTDILSYIKSIFLILSFHGAQTLGGATWFLQCLFGITISYCLIDFIINKVIKSGKANLYIQAIIAIIFSFIGFVCNIKNINLYGLERIFSCYILYWIGILVKNIKYENNFKYATVKIVISFIVLLIINNMGYIALSENYYTNPIFLIIASVTGWIFLYNISYVLNINTYLRKIFSYIGENSMAILILHLLSFKIVNIYAIKIYNLPIVKLAKFPILMEGEYWWILYGIVGIILPLGLKALKNNIKKIGAKKIEKSSNINN